MTVDTPTDILKRSIEQAAWTPAQAEAILSWRFPQADLDRMNALAAASDEGKMTHAERAQLEAYATAGLLLTALHARALRLLHERQPMTAGAA